MSGPGSPLPTAVLEALSKGNLMEAIKLLRNSGMGLKEAKDALETHARGKPAPHAPTFSSASMGQSFPPEAVDGYQQMYHPSDGLSPGQVGDTGSGIWWVIGLVLVCVVGYMVLRRLG